MATISDISFEEGKGSDFFIECVVLDAENIEDFEAYFRMAEDSSVNSPTLISKNSNDPGETIVLFGNRVAIHFTSEETDYSSGLVAGEYYIEVTIEDTGNNKKLVGKGTLTLLDTNIKLGQ